jgi:hypothetical protein
MPSCPLGVLDTRDDDVTVDLPMNTLSRILKVTQFNKFVAQAAAGKKKAA